ncbi:uncharacterized protein LOC130757734 [Actinidia eriantha]|uniref:uncharacterized protein LOC130757734 n=1 Tax=Actinidia eriantha TaxID=165200 RepID=UPI002585143D|nr:uncharacterized protein LOC130757734 [Actinidia eriantha]
MAWRFILCTSSKTVGKFSFIARTLLGRRDLVDLGMATTGIARPDLFFFEETNDSMDFSITTSSQQDHSTSKAKRKLFSVNTEEPSESSPNTKRKLWLSEKDNSSQTSE